MNTPMTDERLREFEMAAKMLGDDTIIVLCNEIKRLRILVDVRTKERDMAGENLKKIGAEISALKTELMMFR